MSFRNHAGNFDFLWCRRRGAKTSLSTDDANCSVKVPVDHAKARQAELLAMHEARYRENQIG